MTIPQGKLPNKHYTSLPTGSAKTLPEQAIYPNNVKRVVVKANSPNYLEPQFLNLESNTFTTIDRNFDELYPNVDFEEL